MFQVNEQKYFASTDGSYIDQDVHRIWPTFTRHGHRPGNGQVQDPRRAQLADGPGLRVPDGLRRGQGCRPRRHRPQSATATATTCWKMPPLAAKQAKEKLTRQIRASRASTTWCSTLTTSA
ncbi:MAG: hypothetical protein WKG07_26220 [Hymenobacter sp.]